MPRSADNLTPKQERFALAYVRLGDASAAYREAYDTSGMAETTINSRAWDMLHKHEGIRVRIELERAALAKAETVEMGELVQNMRDACELARTSGKAGELAQATLGLARITGQLVDKHESHATVEHVSDHKPDIATLLDRAEGKDSKNKDMLH